MFSFLTSHMGTKHYTAVVLPLPDNCGHKLMGLHDGTTKPSFLRVSSHSYTQPSAEL